MAARQVSWFTRMAKATARVSGKPVTFGLAVGTIIVWGVTGPIFGYSDTWQLVINTGTTIVTFLMVFLIQNTQNRDTEALQVKLDELIRVTKAARNDLVGVENKSEAELEHLREDCEADVVAGLKNKMQVVMSKVLPAQATAELHRKMAEPGTTEPKLQGEER